MNEFNNNQQAPYNLSKILREWITYLFKRWWIILSGGLILGISGCVYAWMERPKYESRLTFALEDNNDGMGGVLNLAAEFGLSIGSGKDIFAGDNILEIIRSRHIIERVLLSNDTIDGKVVTMAESYININKVKKDDTKNNRLKDVHFLVGQPRAQFTYLQDSILFCIYKEIDMSCLSARRPDKKLSIYEINVTTPDERFSKIFTEKLIRETTSFYTELRSKRSRETLEILENRVASMKGAANSAINRRAGIQDANINPAFAQQNAEIQQKQLDISAYGGAYGELFKNLELARYQYLKDIPLLQIIDEPHYPMKKVKMGRLFAACFFGLIGVMITTSILLLLKYFDPNKKLS